MTRQVFPLVFALTVAAATPAAAQTFVFHLSGDQEVPPVAAPSSGGCMASLNEPAGELEITCVHDVVDATLMHIHQAPAGANGPVVFNLGDPASPVTATWSGMTPANIADLLAGELYVNIHTAGRPAGQIRGQILTRTVDMVSFALDGDQVVPPSGSAATGSCTADLDEAATNLQIDCTHDLADPDTAHVHEAPAGAVGPEIFAFASAVSPLSANVPLTPRQVAAFAATFLYVDVHGVSGGTEETAGDEIRGQIGSPPEGTTTGGIRIVKRTVPAGGAGFGFTDDVPGSPGAFTLDDGGVETFIAVPPGTYTVTESDPAVGGHSLAGVSCDDGDSTGNPFARTATVLVDPRELVTCTFTNVSTSTAGDLFVFHLSGDQEAPPVPTDERGGCAARLEAAAGTLTIVCTHDVIGATLMHIHRGAPGVNGPPIFDLGDPRSPVEAQWTGMSPADIADLLAGNLYVNIHTGGRPEGAIRGQILPRTVDAGDFPLEAAQEVPPTGSTATGSCSADLSDDGSTLALGCSHDVLGLTAAHLHVAPRGEEGPVALGFDGTSPFQVDLPMTMRLLADFAAGFLYVNLHSEEFPEGEIRGQVVLAAAAAPVIEIPTLRHSGAALLALLLLAVAVRRLAA